MHEKTLPNSTEVPTAPERRDISRLPEKIPPIIFSKWVKLITTQLDTEEFLVLLKPENLDNLHAWAAEECRKLAGEYDATQQKKSRQNSSDEESSPAATHFFLDNEYGKENVWKMLRNGFFAVLSQEVVGRFASNLHDMFEHLQVTDTDTQILCELAMDNGKSIALLNPNSKLATELSASRPERATPEVFGHTAEEYPDAEAWKAVVADEIEKQAAQRPGEVLVYSPSFGYFIDEEHISGTLPLVDQTDDQMLILIKPQRNSEGKVNYTSSYYNKHTFTQTGAEIFLGENLNYFDIWITDTTQALLQHFFDTFSRAWAAEQAKRQSTFDRVLNALAEIQLKGRTQLELEMLNESENIAELSYEDRKKFVLETLNGGFGTGIFEINKVVELEVVATELQKRQEKGELATLAGEILERFAFNMPDFYEFLMNKHTEKDILAAITTFAEAVASGDLEAPKNNKILSEAFSAQQGGAPQTFSRQVDIHMYAALLQEGDKGSAEDFTQKIPTRIPLLLAQLHLSLFSRLLATNLPAASDTQQPINDVAVEFLTDHANRPEVAATGCPAIPNGVMTSASKIYGEFFRFVKQLESFA